MSKSKQILGFFIACTVVVVVLYSISELRKYQSSKNERTQLIKKIVDQFYEECYSENSLDKKKLSNNDKLIAQQCAEEKGKSLLNKKGE